MIYTRFGMKVTIKSFDWTNHIAIVEPIENSNKEYKVNYCELKADDGIKEIDEAIESADDYIEEVA